MKRRLAKKILKLGWRRHESYSNLQYDRAFRRMRPWLDIPTGAW